MLTIARLFGKSPFAPLQSHMKKVSLCIKKLTEIFEIVHEGDQKTLSELVKLLSKLEHEADLTKNDIRNHLPRSLFLPIDRAQLLEILALQDDIADKCEEIGNLLTLHPLQTDQDVTEKLKGLFLLNIEAFWSSRKIIKEMHDLLESSFGGMEAERVKNMIEQTSYQEFEADKAKHELTAFVFKKSDRLSTPAFFLYMKLIDAINEISHLSEKLANRIRMILELK